MRFNVGDQVPMPLWDDHPIECHEQARSYAFWLGSQAEEV
jgi:hypothetical protein